MVPRQQCSNPFDARGWTGCVEVDQLDPVDITSGNAQILWPDPQRLWALIFTQPSSASWFLWMSRPVGSFGMTPEAGQSHLIIHNATFPGAVQGNWWVITTVALTAAHIFTGRCIYPGDDPDVP
jgi:hypothetical protein